MNETALHKRVKRRRRVAKWRRAYSYQMPMQIRFYMRHWCGNIYPICPRCGSSMERDFVCHCDQCGQKLGWDYLGDVRYIEAGDREAIARFLPGTHR